LRDEPRFYFVHSYHWQCANADDELATAKYGYTFTAGVERGNILGVQFHPEKSHSYGLGLYENFLKYY
jgi:glutamine amidotransferase